MAVLGLEQLGEDADGAEDVEPEEEEDPSPERDSFEDDEDDLEDPPEETLRIVLVDGQPIDIQQLEEDAEDDDEDLFTIEYSEEEEDNVSNNLEPEPVFDFDDSMSVSSDLKVYRILMREAREQRRSVNGSSRMSVSFSEPNMVQAEVHSSDRQSLVVQRKREFLSETPESSARSPSPSPICQLFPPLSAIPSAPMISLILSNSESRTVS